VTHSNPSCINILLVEDMAVHAEKIIKILENLELECDYASSVDGAIDYLAQKWYQLILLDLHLEDDPIDELGGIQILDELILRQDLIKEEDQTPNRQVANRHTQVIVLSSFDEYMRTAFLEYRVLDFIQKDEFDEQKIKEIITSLPKRLKNIENRFNCSLEIIPDPDVTLAHIASKLTFDPKKFDHRKWVSGIENKHARAEQEIVMLLRSLFADGKTVNLHNLGGGKSKTFVLRVESGDAQYILKLGNSPRIQQEYNRYYQYIPQLPDGLFPTIVRYGSTPMLKGICYNAVTGDNFGEKYRYLLYSRRNRDQGAITRIINQLFDQTLRELYRTQVTKNQEVTPLYVETLTLNPTTLRNRIYQHFDDVFTVPPIDISDRGYLTFRDIGEKLMDPIDLLEEFIDNPSLLKFTTSIVHGDTNSGNIIVQDQGDRNFNTWLIDFYRTGPNHRLSDFAQLETVIKFELLELDAFDLKSCYDFENALIDPDFYTDPIKLPRLPESEKFEFALEAIDTIRGRAERYSDTEDMTAYYVALFFHTLNSVKFELDDDAIQKEIDRNKRLYALLSAAMIADFHLSNY